MSEDGTEHKFDTGTTFEDGYGNPWEVTNRMVDVDTDEVLYYLQGTEPSKANHGGTEVVPESVLERDSSTWSYVHTET